MSSRYFHWITVALALAAIIVAVICGLAIRKGAEAEQTSNDIFRNYDLREKVKDIFSSIKDAEAGEREFLITGNEECLEPYHVGVNRALEDLKALQRFVDGGELSSSALDQLNQLTADRHRPAGRGDFRTANGGWRRRPVDGS